MNRIIIIVVLLGMVSCKKDNLEFAYGEVINKGGCFSDSWLVKISNPNPEKYTFLCQDTQVPGPGQFNCTNSVYLRLSSNLAQTGKKIKFSEWTKWASCLSSSYAPSHLDAKNVSEQ